MNFLSYALTIIISFIGLFIGFFLIWIAPEEKKPGEKYFNILQYLFLSLISVVLLSYRADLYSILLAVILVPAALFLKKRKFYAAPIMLGAVSYVSSKNADAFLIVSILVLFYNIAVGSLLTDYNKKKQSMAKIIYYNISYLITGILLFFIFC